MKRSLLLETDVADLNTTEETENEISVPYDTTNDLIAIETYAGLYRAYYYFNNVLFAGTLPDCLITVQRHKGAYGYYSGDRFEDTCNPSEIRDEIALNPQHFAGRSKRETLSTLVHEMVHLAQHHYGKPGRGRYHNAQWADIMQAVGLMPSTTGKQGGKKTGDRVSHYIIENGPFDHACTAFLEENSTVLFQDRAYGDEEAARNRTRKAASKTRFVCSGCTAEKAWAKSTARLKCGRCSADLRWQA